MEDIEEASLLKKSILFLSTDGFADFEDIEIGEAILELERKNFSFLLVEGVAFLAKHILCNLVSMAIFPFLGVFFIHISLYEALLNLSLKIKIAFLCIVCVTKAS